jgi:hypothetical protein
MRSQPFVIKINKYQELQDYLKQAHSNHIFEENGMLSVVLNILPFSCLSKSSLKPPFQSSVQDELFKNQTCSTNDSCNQNSINYELSSLYKAYESAAIAVDTTMFLITDSDELRQYFNVKVIYFILS